MYVRYTVTVHVQKVLVVFCCLTRLINDTSSYELTHVVESAMSLTQKILRDIPGAHKACVASTGLTLSSKAKDFLLSDIGIPAPPVLKSEELTMEMSLSRIVEGLELHHKLLQEIGAVLSSTEELKLLLADVRDLSAQLHEMQRLAQIPSTEYQKVFTLNLNSDYQVRVVAHLTLQQLRSFTKDVFYSLRHIALSN